MKIAVLSGKGGTGKTLLSVNLAAMAEPSVYIDCDVEEPNGLLFFRPSDIREEEVAVGVPVLDEGLCSGCRRCTEFCRYNALAFVKNRPLVFDEVCHSCGGCILLCPHKALSEKRKVIGKIRKGLSGRVTVISGEMNIGEASGSPIIRRLIREGRLSQDTPVFFDCPPGSACLVLESIRDADFCILAAEPTLFGAHNLSMVHELVRHINKPYGAVLNKCLEGENPAEVYCRREGIRILGRIPFDGVLGALCADGRIAVRESKAHREMFSSLLSAVVEEAS